MPGSYDGEDFAELDTDSQIQQIAEEEVFSLALKFKNEWQDILIDAGWQDTGESINDITIKPQREGATTYTIGGDVIQLLISEFGRRPGAKMPPEKPIKDWMNRQAGMPNRGDEEFDSVSYLVRKSIAENGIEPVMGGRRAWKRVEDDYIESVERRLEE